ncbi:MAG: NAD(P)/FAD-dependent oxidoreductase [Candidatus Heimdallarchaeota archaeon]|nr:MAG: NAD(P)/FAD-dependent oxidoreductase [Candidatus Heimdallarchaeota archaeon]
MKNEFDLLIIGAGPAGLATALGARRGGVEKILVVDQQPAVGTQLKGQSIHYRPDKLTKIFLGDLPRKAFVSEVKSFGRNYYSPSGKKTFHLEDNVERVWIDFRLFLNELVKEAVLEDIFLRVNSKAINLKALSDSQLQVSIKDLLKNQSETVTTQVIVGAEGANSITAQHQHLPHPSPLCPIIRGHFFGEYNENDMEFLFFSDENLDVAGTSFIFPHGHQNAEFGFIIFPEVSSDPLPDHWKIWKKVLNSPMVREKIRISRFYETTKSTIPMGGPVLKIYKNNCFIIGEAAGHVTPSGGSGILTGLELGLFLGEQLGKSFPKWDEETLRNIEHQILNHPTHEKLSLMAQIILPFRRRLFQELRTWEKIDQDWENITEILSLAFAPKNE